MIHARPDYNRMQDPENKIGEDEPVILFRGQDKHFRAVLKYYYDLIEQDNADPKILKQLEDHNTRLIAWTLNHDQKTPDTI